MKNIKLFLIGVAMGVANVIPGVSGGTIAIIFNIYDKLMECITVNIKVILKNLHFLIPLGLGVIAGILGLSKVMEFLFARFPSQTYFGFIGIILGSLQLIFYKAKDGKVIKNSSWIYFFIAFVIMAITTFFNADKDSGEVLFTSLNFISFVACFGSMTIATATMIIPGISGSMLLIVMGMYPTIYFEVINNFNIALLIPSGIGAVVGLLMGAKLIRYLLKNFAQATYMAILGLLVGSAFQLAVSSGISSGFEIVTCLIVMFIMGFIINLFSQGEMKGE